MPELPPPDPGKMRLYSAVRPRLAAGRYRARLEQRISQGSRTIGVPDPVEVHFDVTAPRFSLPGTEIHSVFPPPNAEGAFDFRLPQIALKRRTLPWARKASAAPGDAGLPWLALVLLSDAEANFAPARPISGAFTTPQVATALGVPSTGTCDHIEVTQRVVDEVFPAKEELPWLSHVRQVSLRDAENLGSDLDGWMAVVIANRLPQPNTRYGAYLISLEGQLHELPPPGNVASAFGKIKVYEDLPATLLQQAVYSQYGKAFRGGAGRVTEPAIGDAAPAGAEAGPRPMLALEASSADGGAERVMFSAIEGTDILGHARRSGWSVAEVEEVSGVRPTAPPLVQEGPFHFIDLEVVDPGARLLRFPVLAKWNFSTGERGDFQALMEHLDVAMLGTPKKDQEDPAEITDTGHTTIELLARRGQVETTWYRGPLTPREVARGSTPSPLFVADQAWAIGEDGRWDLSEAAAFEIGRLLALSDASFAEELARWRRSGFQLSRLSVVAALGDVIADALDVQDVALARALSLTLVKQLSAKQAKAAGPFVQPVEYVDDLRPATDFAAIAAGFGMATDEVRDALGPGYATIGVEPAVEAPESDFGTLLERAGTEFGSLGRRLNRIVHGLSDDAAGTDGRLPAPGEGVVP